MSTDDVIHESVTAKPNQSAKEKFGGDVVHSLGGMMKQKYAMDAAMRKQAEAPKTETKTTTTTTTTRSQTQYDDDLSFF